MIENIDVDMSRIINKDQSKDKRDERYKEYDGYNGDDEDKGYIIYIG